MAPQLGSQCRSRIATVMLCWSRRCTRRKTRLADRWIMSSRRNRVPLIPHGAALSKLSRDKTSACIYERESSSYLRYTTKLDVGSQAGTAYVYGVESRCKPTSRMLAEVMTLHPQIAMGRGHGCRAQWFGGEKSGKGVR